MISKKLKELRKDRDLTQEAMAAIIRVSRTGYVQIEKGKRDVYADEIKRVCVAFMISADWLLGG